jgi:hypothetical protein
MIQVDRCPLGCALVTDSTWAVRVKPKAAAPRILCLDGYVLSKLVACCNWLTVAENRGGVRGIIQLEILREIVKKVDYNIPVQELFDLVIGTSTGT